MRSHGTIHRLVIGAIDITIAAQQLMLAQEKAEHPDAGGKEEAAVEGCLLTLRNTVETYRFLCTPRERYTQPTPTPPKGP